MAGIEVVGAEDIYAQLKDFLDEEQEQDEDYSSIEHLILTSKIFLPRGTEIKGTIDMVRPYYCMCLEATTKNYDATLNFDKRLSEKLKKNKYGFKIAKGDKNLILIKARNDPYFTYGASISRNEDNNLIQIYCGDSGLVPRLISSKKEDFLRNVEEIESLANSLFQPLYLKDKETNSYYLNFFFNSERQIP